MSTYLTKVIFPTIERRFLRTYPANVINSLGTEKLKLDTITILYGSNGSGKSTVLNLIAQKIQCQNRADNALFTGLFPMCQSGKLQ